MFNFKLLFAERKRSIAVCAMLLYYLINTGYNMVYTVFLTNDHNQMVNIGFVSGVALVAGTLGGMRFTAWGSKAFLIALCGWVTAQLCAFVISPGDGVLALLWVGGTSLVGGFVFSSMLTYTRTQFPEQSSDHRNLWTDYGGLTIIQLAIVSILYPFAFREGEALWGAEVSWWVIRIIPASATVIFLCLIISLGFREIYTVFQEAPASTGAGKMGWRQLGLLLTLTIGVIAPFVSISEAITRASKTLSTNVWIGTLVSAYSVGRYLGGKLSAKLPTSWNRQVFIAGYLSLAVSQLVMWLMWLNNGQLLPIVFLGLVMGVLVGMLQSILGQQLATSPQLKNTVVGTNIDPLANTLMSIAFWGIMWGLTSIFGGFELVWWVVILLTPISILALFHREIRLILAPDEKDRAKDEELVQFWTEDVPWMFVQFWVEDLPSVLVRFWTRELPQLLRVTAVSGALMMISFLLLTSSLLLLIIPVIIVIGLLIV